MTLDAQTNRNDKYKAILTDRRSELLRRLTAIEHDFEQPRNPDDEDRATERNNDEVLDELGQTGQKELIGIDAALDRLEKGSFGICVKCGAEIGERRLEIVPHTPFCQSCSAQ
ncbi:TraR/DksA family transcriptional regulator (plasmid) [Agrobacterium vitis]|uniref:TraR/DksA family transcriptional regulator n=1 Tax=Agrobacterium vitis TaxID=373 RepID=UPI003D27FA06